MATFTMNSQKTFVQAPSSKSIFDKAFVFSIGLVILVGGIWAVERVLIYMTDRQIAEYEAVTAASVDALNAEEVRAVHDVTSRLAAIQRENGAKVDVQNILGTLEKSTIPQVSLTEYEYQNEGSIIIRGIVSDYRFLAEQILRYRQESLFATAEVRTTGRNDSGQVTFDIQVEESAAPAEVVPVPTSTP